MHPVDGYAIGQSFFFGTKDASLVATGHSVTLPGRSGDAGMRAHAVLKSLGPNEILVGAVPFSDTAQAHLVVPESYQWASALEGQPLAVTGPQSGVGECVPSPQEYEKSVAAALGSIHARQLDKVVLTRSVEVPLQRPLDVPQTLRILRHQQSDGYVFACELPERRTLLGASPELLISRKGDTVRALPLAGSRPRSGDPHVDTTRGLDLMESDKDRREHAFVVDTIATALAPYCRELSVPTAPSVVAASRMLHLGTVITGRLLPDAPPALALAHALHPTPAVCGTPTATARAVIDDLEGYDRGFYTGMVGWSDARGNGQWAVTIRCAEATATTVRLYAGAGVVEGSTPESELAETDAKLATMQGVLSHYTGKVDNGRSIHTVAG
ncbi:isochorismate synthase [Natronoglycomyces albus]|uniref:isochorismate synthase n=1 Tax=Natronoglycomyces albus TaxID=2811108 RepID=A0A895XNV7_9ACTN|nr:isochorismate synthase [Natronoglycomyces albus]QSB03980.1 isochorismate synthase [Natronoglycomyces albus]